MLFKCPITLNLFIDRKIKSILKPKSQNKDSIDIEGFLSTPQGALFHFCLVVSRDCKAQLL